MELETLKGYARLFRARRFLWEQRKGNFDVPLQPDLDDLAKDWFVDRIRSSRVYLEYGSGGSTLYASEVVDTLVSVESDRYFLRAIKAHVKTNENQTQELIYANIGPTGTWGTPIFRKQTHRRANRWASYAQAPWLWLQSRNLEPDTIMVDGRFRVACVLESTLNIQNPNECVILMDDFKNRPYYHDVGEFCNVLQVEGRMAIMRPKPNIDRDALRERLKAAYRDFR